MFGLGMSEIILLSVMALIIIGPKQLPEVARTIGRFINDLKRSTEGLKDDIKRQALGDLEIEEYLKEKRSKEETEPTQLSLTPATETAETKEQDNEKKETKHES